MAEVDETVREIVNDLVEDVSVEVEMDYAFRKGHSSPPTPSEPPNEQSEVTKCSCSYKQCRFEGLLFEAIREAVIYRQSDTGRTLRHLNHVKTHLMQAMEDVGKQLDAVKKDLEKFE